MIVRIRNLRHNTCVLLSLLIPNQDDSADDDFVLTDCTPIAGGDSHVLQVHDNVQLQLQGLNGSGLEVHAIEGGDIGVVYYVAGEGRVAPGVDAVVDRLRIRHRRAGKVPVLGPGHRLVIDLVTDLSDI